MDDPGETEMVGRCAMCGGRKLFAACLGCGLELCERCARFELIGSGCGCVWPVYYCKRCVQDPSINLNAMLREPEVNPAR
jgi:hypothetical protein